MPSDLRVEQASIWALRAAIGDLPKRSPQVSGMDRAEITLDDFPTETRWSPEGPHMRSAALCKNTARTLSVAIDLTVAVTWPRFTVLFGLVAR